MVLSGNTVACECVPYAIEALKRVHIRLKFIPSIAVNRNHRSPGYFRRGIVEVWDINDCRTLVHELVHESQWEKDGDAADIHENHRRELKADAIAREAMSEMGACDVQR